jgi:hypothetical protein
MQEDGAPAPADTWPEIIVQYDDDIVKTVVPPEGLMARPKRKPNLTIVTPIVRIIAPAILFANGGCSQAAGAAKIFVWTKKSFDDFKPPGRGGAIPFPLSVGNSA